MKKDGVECLDTEAIDNHWLVPSINLDIKRDRATIAEKKFQESPFTVSPKSVHKYSTGYLAVTRPKPSTGTVPSMLLPIGSLRYTYEVFRTNVRRTDECIVYS